MKLPTSKQIKWVRQSAQLTQTEAANIIHKTLSHWQKLESGTYEISMSDWELFLIKTNMQSFYSVISD